MSFWDVLLEAGLRLGLTLAAVAAVAVASRLLWAGGRAAVKRIPADRLARSRPGRPVARLVAWHLRRSRYRRAAASLGHQLAGRRRRLGGIGLSWSIGSALLLGFLTGRPSYDQALVWLVLIFGLLAMVFAFHWLRYMTARGRILTRRGSSRWLRLLRRLARRRLVPQAALALLVIVMPHVLASSAQPALAAGNDDPREGPLVADGSECDALVTVTNVDRKVIAGPRSLASTTRSAPLVVAYGEAAFVEVTWQVEELSAGDEWSVFTEVAFFDFFLGGDVENEDDTSGDVAPTRLNSVPPGNHKLIATIGEEICQNQLGWVHLTCDPLGELGGLDLPGWIRSLVAGDSDVPDPDTCESLAVGWLALTAILILEMFAGYQRWSSRPVGGLAIEIFDDANPEVLRRPLDRAGSYRARVFVNLPESLADYPLKERFDLTFSQPDSPTTSGARPSKVLPITHDAMVADFEFRIGASPRGTEARIDLRYVGRVLRSLELHEVDGVLNVDQQVNRLAARMVFQAGDLSASFLASLQETDGNIFVRTRGPDETAELDIEVWHRHEDLAGMVDHRLAIRPPGRSRVAAVQGRLETYRKTLTDIVSRKPDGDIAPPDRLSVELDRLANAGENLLASIPELAPGRSYEVHADRRARSLTVPWGALYTMPAGSKGQLCQRFFDEEEHHQPPSECRPAGTTLCPEGFWALRSHIITSWSAQNVRRRALFGVEESNSAAGNGTGWSGAAVRRGDDELAVLEIVNGTEESVHESSARSADGTFRAFDLVSYDAGSLKRWLVEHETRFDVVHFLGHGMGSLKQLKLSCQTIIDGKWITNLGRNGVFSRHPLVILNACYVEPPPSGKLRKQEWFGGSGKLLEALRTAGAGGVFVADTAIGTSFAVLAARRIIEARATQQWPFTLDRIAELRRTSLRIDLNAALLMYTYHQLAPPDVKPDDSRAERSGGRPIERTVLYVK